MQLEDLFEKREKSQLMLISTLMNQPIEAELKDVLTKTSLSRSTLLKYIDDLNELAQTNQFELSLQFENDRLMLHMGDHVTKEDLIQLLLPFSIKNKILTYLYQHEEVTVQKMAQVLLVSEATLHRQLSTLNTLLEEFGLSIKNGRLIGEEHQIRYFFYQLFWLTTPKKEFSHRFRLTQFTEIMDALQQFWTSEISKTNQLKLGLWFSITKKRIGIRKKNFKHLKQLMMVYLPHRFYQQVRQQMLRYLSRYALEVEEEEAMCQFIFVTSMSILPPQVMEHKLGYGGPVSDATTTGLRVVRTIISSEENLSEQGMYTLNQVLGQLYFFKGALLDRAYRTNQDLSIVASSMYLEYADLAEKIIQSVVEDLYQKKIQALGDLYIKIKWRLIEVLSFVIYQTPRSLMIGVDLTGSETKRLPVLSVLRQTLEVNRLVLIEPFERKRKFDLVISNVYDQSYHFPYYFLKGAPNSFDIQRLEALIDRYLSDKNK